MITRLDIENFRGLRNVTLDGLRNVNLIVGGNDTGKTSILEALILLLGDGSMVQNLPITFRANQNGTTSLSPHDDRVLYWPWLFYDRNIQNKLIIKAELDDSNSIRVFKTARLDTRYSNPPEIYDIVREGPLDDHQEILNIHSHSIEHPVYTFAKKFKLIVLSTRPSNPGQDAESYNQVALMADGELRIESIMRAIEPRLKRLRYAKLPGTNSPLIFVDLGLSQAVPAPQMGQAFNRILHIYTQLIATKSNVLLVDEIENGIFSDSMEKIWKGLFAICRQEKIQIFATTHSRECVMAALAASKETPEDELSVQRLQLIKDQVEAVHLSEKHLELAAEMGLEVRA